MQIIRNQTNKFIRGKIMPAITQSLLASLNTGFKKVFQDAYSSFCLDSQFMKISTKVQSNSKSNTYGWLGQFPALREWIGERVLKNISNSSYQITNKTYESSISVAREDIEDDNIGIYSPLFQEMARAAAYFPDEQVFELLKNGNNTLCYDGQNFFDTDHKVYQSNDGTGAFQNCSNFFDGANPAWYLLDCKRSIKPLIYQERKKAELNSMVDGQDEYVFMRNTYRYGIETRGGFGYGFWQTALMSKEELNEDTLEKAYAHMRSFTTDGGRKLGIKPTILVVNPSMRAKALRLVKAELIDGTTNINSGLLEVLDSEYL